ncbi:lipopolysaccharide assembly protein LapB [Ferruginibacter sp. HRS2-29]|uniref:tetratricopeptide repeat protein n=1 Tax=Ferruginibacter sp. HRS2-29 TaxID=2487334 RepID=UPI0020CF6BD9|nr:hypothetical protein [Ferruginibacter sp. HRS2-29]MCP9750319.1 hypothetical protein [Ferruginibacter sp. HRS2-29]
MKKIFMLSILFAVSAPLFAQSLKDIGTLVLLNKYADAKTSVDKFLAEPKNESSADAWYYKGRIYNALSYDTVNPRIEAMGLKSTSFDAFKKYQVLDAKDTRMKEEENASFLNLYYGFYDLGATFFNKKDFDNSTNAFKKALEVREYINSKKITYKETNVSAIDTSLILNVAIAATQAKKTSEAAAYYKKIVDAGIAGPGYLEVYQFLADYYAKANDQANLQPLLTQARAKYPENEFWDEVELNTVPKNTEDKTALYAKYDELLAKNPSNYNLNYNYAVEYYNSLYGNDGKPKDPVAAKAKLTSVLTQAIKYDKGVDATVLMTNHLYNIAADLSSAAVMVKGTKPEDVKKKAELKKQANAKMDELIPYAEKALKYYSEQPTLKGIQKGNQKIIVGYLIEIYGMKGDKAKVAEYEKVKAGLPN